jgi:hypothetical protein
MILLQVKEKRTELEKLKTTFVRRASEFLRNYFASLVDFMISDKSYFSQVFFSFLIFLYRSQRLLLGLGILIVACVLCMKQRGQLKRPDHADLRYKCRTYARLLQHLKVHDKPFAINLISLLVFSLSLSRSCSLLTFPCFCHQSLDKNCLGPLRKAYCSSLNLLLRREVKPHLFID